MLQDLPDTDWIAHAPHPDVLRALVRLGLRLDALVQPWHLEALLRFVRSHPELPVVIDHAAKPQLGAGWSVDWALAWHRQMAALAACAQVECKFSGLLTEAAGPARCEHAAGVALLRPVWDSLLQWFGPERLLWGSDWPVCELVCSYEDWRGISGILINRLSFAEREQVQSAVARKTYGI